MPTDVAFATKPTLASRMILAALDAGVPARWLAGDKVYGADPTQRNTLESRGVGYVLAEPATGAPDLGGLLVRRNDSAGEQAQYLTNSPHPVPAAGNQHWPFVPGRVPWSGWPVRSESWQRRCFPLVAGGEVGHFARAAGTGTIRARL